MWHSLIHMMSINDLKNEWIYWVTRGGKTKKNLLFSSVCSLLTLKGWEKLLDIEWQWSTTGSGRLLLSQQLLAQIDFLVFAVMTRNCSVVSGLNVTWGGTEPLREDLVTLSVETQHQSRFTLLMCPQVVIWVSVRSRERDSAARLITSTYNMLDVAIIKKHLKTFTRKIKMICILLS